MQKFLSKSRYYIEEYVAKDKILKALIVPALLALVAYNFLEIKTFQSIAEITNKTANPEYRLQTTIMFCVYFTIGYSMLLLYEIFNAYFVAVSVKSSIINFFSEFIWTNYKSFHSIGLGEAQYCINRRLFSLIEFLSAICIDFVSNMLFVCIAISSLSKEIVNSELKIIVLLLIIGFVGLSIFFQYLRSNVRFKVNQGVEKSSRKMYDILYNYERIVTYDNLEFELEKYEASMDDQVFYSIIFWVSYEIVSFFNMIFFLGINIYCLFVLGLSNKETLDLKSFTLVFNKTKEKVINMIESIDSLATNFVNLDQNILENCKLDEQEGGIDTLSIPGYEIEINNLVFKYDKDIIISNLSLKIEQGQKLAIAGPNGSVKSTLLKIIEGFYDYDGTIKIDGIDVKCISKRKIREHLGYISQTAFLFDSTIMDNLKLGQENATDEKVIEYAKLYNMHDMLKELGYNLRVGEKGKRLSGGQRQKICFLRAIIKNSPIMIFDEPTANMDQKSEFEMLENIKNHLQSKTVLMIVHNLELLPRFDKILYLDPHNTIEEGHFDDLMIKKGHFYNFYMKSLKKEQ